MIKLVKTIPIWTIYLLVLVSFVYSCEDGTSPNYVFSGEPNFCFCPDRSPAQAKNDGDSKKKGVLIEFLLFLIAAISLYFTGKSASAAQQSATAASRAVQTATSRSLDIITPHIKKSFGGIGFPPADEYKIRFLNTGKEVIRLTYSGCKAGPAKAFNAEILSIAISNDIHLVNVQSNIPIMPGAPVEMNMRISFDGNLLRGVHNCEGKLSFEVIPALDTGETTIEVDCEFLSD